MNNVKLEITQQAFVPVDKGLLRNKQYMVNLRAIIESYSCMKDDKKVIAKDRMRWIMRQGMNLSYKKINSVINAFLDLGLISEYDNDNYVIEFIKPFIVLEPETINYCIDVLSELSFKVYCYLMGMYQLHLNGNYNSPWRFCISGEKGLLRVCGYSDSAANKKKMGWVLETLQKVGLIEISTPLPFQGLDGHYQGWYRYLYKVNSISHPQKIVTENTVVQEYLKPRLYNGTNDSYDYSIKWFDSNTMLDTPLLKDKRNKEALEYALKQGDIPSERIEIVKSTLASWK